MADVILHPAARAQLLARLAEVEDILALIDSGLPQLLDKPEYRASTAMNAYRDGVSIEDMHRAGLEGARLHFEAEAATLRAVTSA